MDRHKQIIETKKIINCLIKKGGLYGAVAKLYGDDYEKSIQFIAEVSEQCHTSGGIENWGNKLIKDILKYKNTFK